jgi:hypothetical protein
MVATRIFKRLRDICTAVSATIKNVLVLAAPPTALGGNIHYDHVDVSTRWHRIAFEHFFTSLEPATPRSFSGVPRSRNEARRGRG